MIYLCLILIYLYFYFYLYIILLYIIYYIYICLYIRLILIAIYYFKHIAQRLLLHGIPHKKGKKALPSPRFRNISNALNKTHKYKMSVSVSARASNIILTMLVWV